MAGALGVLWEGGRCRDTERPAAAQLRVLAQDQMALLVSALVPLLSYSDAKREAHGVANRQGPWDQTDTGLNPRSAVYRCGREQVSLPLGVSH